MPDYYTSDATQMPFSAIFSGGGERWPIWIRLMFAFRKIIRLHYTPSYARCAPEQWHGIKIEDLPASVRKGLESAIAEMEPHGFTFFDILRSETIGMQVSYNAVLIATDRATSCAITALRTGVGTISRSAFVTGLRSDLTDGTILLTGRGPKFPSYMLRPHQKVEMLPETIPTPELIQRHLDRLRDVPAHQIKTIPTENVAGYFLASAKSDWDDFMATGMFRKLSAREVARLGDIQFDFE